MALDKTQLEADLQFIIDEDPVVVIHEGDTFNGVKSALNNEAMFTDIGKQYEIDFTLIALISSFGTPPETGQDISIAGIDYKITVVDTDNVDVGYRIYVENETGLIS